MLKWVAFLVLGGCAAAAPVKTVSNDVVGPPKKSALEQFDAALGASIDQIYRASVEKA